MKTRSVRGILLATAVAAQAFPAKSIRIIAPFPPASVADVLARPIAQKMNETWGQPVIVDNRTGAAGTVGADVAAKAPPDGYTILFYSSSFWLLPFIRDNLPYDPVKDFTPVALTTMSVASGIW